MEKKYIEIATLTRYLKNKFDTDPHIQNVHIKGEISNFKGHTRGHLYFTLKDEEARISAVMFQGNASKLSFMPEDGMKVLVTGRVSIYPATGQYQIYIEEMDEDGLGNLYLKYEALKKELAEKGLFDEDNKKPIPKYPTKIGIITAPTGAAIKDILSTLKRRYPICETYLFPSLVQGELAKDDIVKKIKEADNHNLDLLIVGRGGGSIEDLWAFNEEVVAYAIYEAKTPIISAVGHEIDFTIADFVADLRAPTPTAAAELAVPNIIDLNTLISQYTIRCNKIVQNMLILSENKLNSLTGSYALKNPLAVYEIKEQKLSILITNINNIIENILIKNKNSYELSLQKIELLNPIAILSKGYSVIKSENKIIKDAKKVKKGDLLDIKLSKGEIKAVVEGVK